MTTATIDTFRIVKRLREAGLDERQAETITDVIREVRDVDIASLATKSDIASLRAEIAMVETRLDGKIGMVEARLKGEIVASRNELLKWLFPAMLGQVGLMAALVKLL